MHQKQEPLAGTPVLHRPVSRPQRAQTVTHHFALGRIFACSHFRFDNLRHVAGQPDAHVLGVAHGFFLVTADWI